MKKLFTFLAGMLVTFVMCLNVIAATVYSEGYFYYIVEDNAITITGYFGTEKEVKVPSSIAGVPVSTIATAAFVGTSVKSLDLPDTITDIKPGAIAGDIAVSFDLGSDSISVVPDVQNPDKAVTSNGNDTEASNTKPAETGDVDSQDVDNTPEKIELDASDDNALDSALEEYQKDVGLIDDDNESPATDDITEKENIQIENEKTNNIKEVNNSDYTAVIVIIICGVLCVATVVSIILFKRRKSK